MKPKLYVMDNMFPIALDSRLIDIIKIGNSSNSICSNIILEPESKVPMLVNNTINIDNHNFMGYPWIVRDVKDSLITMATKLRQLGIRHPKSMLITNISIIELPLYLEHGKKYILKKDLKARSMCKLVTDKQTLLDFVDFRCSVFGNKVTGDYVKDLLLKDKDKSEVCLGDDYEDPDKVVKYYLENVLKNSVGEVRNDSEIIEAVNYYTSGDHNYFIQEFIGIEEEYRLVWFNTGNDSDWVMLRRHSHDILDTTKPFNMEVDLIWKEEDKNSILDSLTDLDIPLRERIKMLGASLNTFRLSIDLYKDYNGNFGIIEYQTELFQHEIPNIMELNTKALVYTIENLKAQF